MSRPVLAMMLAAAVAPAGDVGFVEDFALAADRAEALKLLVPGTEDAYYYQALHLLATERLDQVKPLFTPWQARFGRTARLMEVETRLALLSYDRDPQGTLAYLRDKLGLRHDHRRQVPGAAPDLPTALDPAALDVAALTARAVQGRNSLDQLEDAALHRLAATDLTPPLRRELLQRVRRPDVPNLVKLIDAELRDNGPAFGGRPVDAQLTVAQLDELAKLNPQQLNQPAFVTAYLTKLQPGADDDRARDKAVARTHLDRLLAFADRLAPVHNPLKAHVRYHRLVLDRATGVTDKATFLAYLALPRRQPYMAQRLNESAASQQHPADLGTDYSAATLLPPVGGDEPLVRDTLKRFLRDAPSPAEFEPYLDGDYLRRLFAEAKIEAGLGDPERWAAALPPEAFRALRERVDIDFAPTNKSEFAADEAVALDLFVKNVPGLRVKVYEVNTGAAYRATGKEIDTDLQLDGLVPNAERVLDSTDGPLIRKARRVELPELTKPGVYVVDLIGSGKSSRALVRKSRLRPLVSPSPVGLKVRVIDDQNRPVPAATLWLGGTEYAPDKDGVLTIPFSTSPGRKPVVLTAGGLSSLDHIDQPGEGYALTAGVFVDRESLLANRLANILVRPGLRVNGRPASVKLLENVRLRVVSTDHAGVTSAVDVPSFPLFEDRESVQEIRVPARLASLTVTLSASVKSLTTDKPVELSVTEAVGLNGLDKTDGIECLHLAQFGGEHLLELFGKTGEPKPDRAVRVSLKHREFKQPVQATLKTDARGRVRLGALPGVVIVTATGPDGVARNWPLPGDRHTRRSVVHAAAGEVVRVPYLGTLAKAGRDELALFDVKGDTVRADRFDALTLTDGMVVVTGLAAGDYDLHLKAEGHVVRVRVAAGPTAGGFVLGKLRQLQLPGLAPLAIASITADDTGLSVKLTGSNPFARVHVIAARYRPAFDPFAKLAVVGDAELGAVLPGHAPSVYLTGRDIGDEYRYVLDRQGKKRFPGVMVERPGLLLHPWAVRATETGVQDAKEGGQFGGVGAATPTVPGLQTLQKGELRPEPFTNTIPGGDHATLDFLADPSAVLVNLVPDQDGVVRVPRDKLGPHALIHVVAVDPLSTAVRTVGLPEAPAKTLDLRLAKGLDPAGHFTQQRAVTVLDAGKPFAVADVAGSRFKAYDSVAGVHALYVTLLADPKLTEFAFVATWPKLSPDDKKAKYSQFACHELNHFLSRKDPEFFNAVVKPTLANKKDKTFLDHYLLGNDLTEFAKPWAFGRLNTVERVLLASRLAGERPKVARHLADLLKLTPPAADRQVFGFSAAVAGDDLSTTNGFAENRAKIGRVLVEGNTALADRAILSQNAPPAPAGGPLAARERLMDEAKSAAEPMRRAGRAEDAAKQPQDAYDGKAGGKRGLFDADRATALGKLRLPFRRIDQTMEWAENNYYKLPVAQQVAALVPVGPLWAEWAAADDKAFRSKHLADAARNFTEAMFALSVLDLPFDPAKPKQEFADGGLTYTPAGPAVVFSEQVRPAAAPPANPPVLLSQNVYRADDRYRDDSGERADKFVAGEFLTQVVYGSQVVVTNPTSGRQRLSVLIQLPTGALPVGNVPVTRTVNLDLQPYRTEAIDTKFYFPRPGTFAQFPAHVAKGETVAAAATATTFTVVEKPTKPDTGTWDWVSQNGTLDEVTAYLKRENVHALNLDQIAWRMAERPAFEAVLAVLQERHAYSPTLWSYALKHNDPVAARQYLLHADALVNEAGGPLVSPLLVIDPVARHAYEHLEYRPLVNARAHALGAHRQVVNPVLLAQYQRFLKSLTYTKEPTDADRLALTYHLLLQDRVEEAATHFARVNPEAVPTKLQYDYCAAYLGLATDDPAKARSLTAKHAAEPVDRWRDAFAQIGKHLDEAEGKAVPADSADRDRRQGTLAATEPAVEVTVAGKDVRVTARNLPSVTVNYYLMDVELLFSRTPFVQQSGQSFAVIRPNKSVVVPVQADKAVVQVPAELAAKNLLVEVTGGGKTRSAVYYAGAVGVSLAESYGQLTASGADGKPLPAVYVKVYARTADGRVLFHKDGYTDRRGRFDYATVSTPERGAVERFAVLVLDDARGAAVREAAPPPR